MREFLYNIKKKGETVVSSNRPRTLQDYSPQWGSVPHLAEMLRKQPSHLVKHGGA